MRRPAPRPAALALAVLVALVALVALAGCGSAGDGDGTSRASSGGPTSTAATDVPTLEVEGASTAAPTAVRLPSIGVDSALDALDLLPDGTLEAPPRWQVAGWYAGGTAPGDRGPAVIAGHVDSPDGPAVFADLDRLGPGDVVEVDHEDGTTTTFAVDRTEVFRRDEFPSAAVYGPVPDAQLRLITCDGAYSAERGYADNLVVFATAVDA